jgi:hypothetical protein
MVDPTRRAEAVHLAWVIADLARLEEQGQLGPEGRSLLTRYRAWQEWQAGAPAGMSAALPPPPSGSPLAPPPPPAASSPVTAPASPPTAWAPPSPGLDLRRLLTVHGVLLLSYAGALLLVSATVLFLAYGPEGLGAAAVPSPCWR